MKIIILCSNLESGGAQRAALRLCAEFRKMGIDSENWFLYIKTEAFLDTSNMKIILPRKIKSPFDYFTIVKKLFFEFRRVKPYAVISFLHYSNIIGLSIAALSGVKFRVASHRNISTGDMSVILRLFDTLCAKLGIYTSITAVSESTKRSFHYYPKKKYNEIKVVHNGLTYLPSDLSVYEARVELGLPVNVSLLGNIGRLSEQKNQKLLVDALFYLPDVHLVLVGEGDLKAGILNQAKNMGVLSRLHLLGEIPITKVPDFFRAIDIFVMPSLFEGLSNALIEALNAGVPILASDVDAQKDVLLDSSGVYSGLLLPVSEVEPWVKAVSELLNNVEKKQILSNSALIRAKDFTMKKMVNGFLSTIPGMEIYRD